MNVRIWFWCPDHPNPHVIDRGEGGTVSRVMRNLFVPLGERGWKISERCGQVYCRRGSTGYCGEPEDGLGPMRDMVVARERLTPPRERLRERL